MSGQNSAIIAAIYDALQKQDLPFLVNVIDPQIIITQTQQLPWGGEYHGADGLHSFTGKMLQTIQPQVKIESQFEAGDQVVVLGRTQGVAHGNGAYFDVALVHIWSVQDGKVTRFEPYIDTPAMRAALEGKESK